jgi:hypothetical protein
MTIHPDIKVGAAKFPKRFREKYGVAALGIGLGFAQWRIGSARVGVKHADRYAFQRTILKIDDAARERVVGIS